MNGFISRTLVVVCLTGGLAAGGCRYRDVVDPCWPERYEYMARKEVCEALTPQVQNGHILDQTVWNYHFESGTAKLTLGGQDKIVQLIRRRPCPDPTIYLASAQDIVYDSASPEKFAEARCELDSKRVLEIQKYITAQTAGRNLAFQVVTHDPAVVDQSADQMSRTLAAYGASFTPVGNRVYSTPPGTIGAATVIGR
jgi:hypothetical protein